MLVGWWVDWRVLKWLPYDGEIGDQPAWVVDVIRLAEISFQKAQARRQAASVADVERKLAELGKGR